MKFKQGKYSPIFPEKYIGDITDIVFRSGLELKFFYLCDNNSNILEWSSETIAIPYISIDNKRHKYYVDLYLKVRDKDGSIQKFLAEIKPLKFSKEPKLPGSGRKTKAYLLECRNWLINQQKWKFAKEFASKNNMKFLILTEKDL